MQDLDKFVIKDVELNWLQVITPDTKWDENGFYAVTLNLDPSQAQQITDAGGVVKTNDDNTLTFKAKKKAKTAKGEPTKKPRILGGDKVQWDEEKIKTIGNGSRGNVLLQPVTWEFGGKQGTSVYLDAIQMTVVKEYTGGGGLGDDAFDLMDTTTDTSGPAIDDDVMF